MTAPVLGLDLSVTHTGVAWWDEPGQRWAATTIKPPAQLRGVERLACLRKRLTDVLWHFGVDLRLVVVEGYSFGSKGRGVYQVAEWGGVARLAIHDAGLPLVELAPGQLKKLASGKGTCDKAVMAATAARRLGADPGDEHQADAIWLAAAGHLLLRAPPVPSLPLVQRDALADVALPRREGVDHA